MSLHENQFLKGNIQIKNSLGMGHFCVSSYMQAYHRTTTLQNMVPIFQGVCDEDPISNPYIPKPACYQATKTQA